MHGDQFSQESTGERHFKLFSCMHGLASHMFMFHFASCCARCSWCMHGLYIACTRPAGSQFLIGLDVPHWKLPALDAMIMFDCVHLFILAS